MSNPAATPVRIVARLRREIFPAVVEDVAAAPAARLDGYVVGGTRALSIVLAVSLLVLHAPTALFLSRDPAALTPVVICGVLALAIAVFASRPEALGYADACAAAITITSAVVILASAQRPSETFPSYSLLLVLPIVSIAMVAYAPMRLGWVIATALGTLTAHLALWRTGVIGGPGSFHGVAFAFDINGWLSAAVLSHVRRGGLSALFEREQELELAHAETRGALARLQSAQLLLVSSERMAALGRLSAGIAHELNTPLAACRASLTEIRARVDELAESVGHEAVTDADLLEIVAEIRGAAELSEGAADRAAGIVRVLKKQATVMAASDERDFDPVAEVRTVVSLSGHRIRRSRAEVTLEVGEREGAPWLRGDPAKLAQIVNNLLENALAACDDAGCAGPIRVTIGRRNDALELRVIDRGPGVAPHVRERIFEPTTTTKPAGEGTGLGLAISRHLAERGFGGTLHHEPTPGGGATFVLRLPIGR